MDFLFGTQEVFYIPYFICVEIYCLFIRGSCLASFNY